MSPEKAHSRIVQSVLELCGGTPLIEIRKLEQEGRGRVLAKAEHLNPGGSVKDRICAAMIEAAEARGQLRKGGVVIEPTSGNTGIGLALVCGAKGYRCILTMPASMSLERRRILEAYGAELVLTDPEAQMQGAIDTAQAIADRTPGSFIPHQFENPENPKVHETTTGREILAAVGDEPIDAFVAGVGTGGTISGVGRALKAHWPKTRIIAIEPAATAVISGGPPGPSKIQGLGAGFIPKNYDPSVVDEVRTIEDRFAYSTKVALARSEGLLVGISTGANVRVALDVARELGPEALVVTILCDTGERYFSLDEYFH